MEQYTNPKEWGPHFWFVIRCVANNYPESPTEDDIKYTKTFFYALQYTLPCAMCRESYTGHFNKHNIDLYLTTNKKLIEWTDIIYNETTNKINLEKTELEQKKITKTVGTQRVCSSCGHKKGPIDENLFPQANENNTGKNLGKVGGLRFALTVANANDRNMLFSFYNWIKVAHTIPTNNEAINIIKGYNKLKNINTIGFYPEFFNVNNLNIFITEQNSYILTDNKTSQLIHNNFKKLSI